MGRKEQVKAHCKCIAWDVEHNKLERVWFHIKGIFRAIFSWPYGKIVRELEQRNEKPMKTYKTYNARNAVKAALVTNYIKSQKKLGVSHVEAKAEAYRLYNIKAGLPFLKAGLSSQAQFNYELNVL